LGRDPRRRGSFRHSRRQPELDAEAVAGGLGQELTAEQLGPRMPVRPYPLAALPSAISGGALAGA
jgi:hypothetical protein